jgi:hypothetical protein
VYLFYISSYCCRCVLVLLYMWRCSARINAIWALHTATGCILLKMRPYTALYQRHLGATYIPAYCYRCGLILLYIYVCKLLWRSSARINAICAIFVYEALS